MKCARMLPTRGVAPILCMKTGALVEWYTCKALELNNLINAYITNFIIEQNLSFNFAV
jgi:hypothetical protein